MLKHYLDQGVSKAELSRRFGVSRRTIHSWIESGQLDRDLSSGESSYAPRPRVAHKLDPYKAIRNKGHFPSDEAATKLIYLALRNITAKWKNPPREWHAAKAQFAIQFGDRFVLTV